MEGVGFVEERCFKMWGKKDLLKRSALRCDERCLKAGRRKKNSVLSCRVIERAGWCLGAGRG